MRVTILLLASMVLVVLFCHLDAAPVADPNAEPQPEAEPLIGGIKG